MMAEVMGEGKSKEFCSRVAEMMGERKSKEFALLHHWAWSLLETLESKSACV